MIIKIECDQRLLREKQRHFGSAVSERDTPENELQKANERVSANILKENSNISMTNNIRILNKVII